MPKIKDLGINIVPGTMRPPEIGGGGAACGFTFTNSQCDCISNQCLPHSGWVGARGVSDCNCVSLAQQRVGGAMTDTVPTCSCECFPTYTPLCSQCDCISNDVCRQRTDRIPSECNCVSNVQSANCVQCVAASRGTFVTPHTPNLAAGVLTRDDIAKLRAQLKQGLENLDIAEKNLLPKTVEEIDAREKELQRELDALKARRTELKK